MLAGHLTLVVAALFTGAAIYISVAEHPARLLIDDRAALAHWQPAYQRGAAMQSSLAIIGFLLGVLAWWRSGDGRWLLGGLILVANWPYTVAFVMPANRKLKATDLAQAGPETRALLRRWGALHAGRSLLGCIATLVMLWAAMG